MSPLDIYRLARGAGLTRREAITATAIALAESGGNPSAVGDTSLTDATWGPSVGLWQIRSLKAETGRGTSRDVTRLKNASLNAASMAVISGGGENWRPWSVFTSGAYKQYLDEAEAAARGEGSVSGGVAQQVSLTDDVGGMIDKATDPFGLRDDALGWLGDRAEDAQGYVADKAIQAAAPVVLTGVVVLGGLALIVAGVAVTVRPAQESLMGGLAGAA